MPDIARPDSARSFEAPVLEVIDGDSVTIVTDDGVRRFEIMGADAPEWIERARQQPAYALESRRFLTNMLLGERVLVFEPEPEQTDPLGRRRAYFFRLPDMAFVDLEIVRQGYGKVSTRAGEPYREVLAWYETRAREAGRGVWGLASEPPETVVPLPVVSTPASTPRVTEPETRPPPPQPAETTDWVWITRSGSKYHREDCSHLTSTRTRVRRSTVGTTHEPCKSCTPDA